MFVCFFLLATFLSDMNMYYNNAKSKTVFGTKFLLSLSLMVVHFFAHGSQRTMETINEGWHFYRGEINLLGKPIPQANWESINLPHTWNAEDAYELKEYYRGAGYYKRNLKLPVKYKGKRIFIKFEGALLYAEVWVNGKHVGSHKGGYTAFSFDVTDYVNLGDNALMVKVDNSMQDISPLSGDFTLFGGIYRDVWLITTEAAHFDMENMGSDGIFITTSGVAQGNPSVALRGKLQYHGKKSLRLRILNEVYNAEGKLVATSDKKIKIQKAGTFDFVLDAIAIPKAHLWSPDTPYLYIVKTKIEDLQTKQVIDELSNPLGLRWFRFDPKEGFFLNGKSYKLNGVCRHQDQKGLGSALSDEMHRRDIKLVKELGANFIRISHYPQDRAILEQCDRLGLLVWEEIPIVDMVADNPAFFSSCESQLSEMIRQHYNHPSIIMWGYMNEIMLGTIRKVTDGERPKLMKATVALAKRLESLVQQEDPLRTSVVAQHSDSTYDKLGLSEISKVIGWNLYKGWYGGDFSLFGKFLDTRQKIQPDKPLIVSEYGAGSDRRVHSLQPECFDFSIEYQQLYLEKMLPMINERKFVAGATLWNFIDFSSAIRDETMPRINNKGILYNDRSRKDVFYYYKSAWRSDTPVLHIASRDWSDRMGLNLGEGKGGVTQPVKVYANLKEVELFHNGRSLGKKKLENCNAIWQVDFVEGQNILIAKGTWKDKEVNDIDQVNFKSYPFFLHEVPRDFELAVNVGSTSYFTDGYSNLTWVPDKSYVKGSWGHIGGKILRSTPDRIGVQMEIKGTYNQPLFQTMLTDLSSYKFDVPTGSYELEVLLTEPGEKQSSLLNDIGFDPSTAQSASQFSLSINGSSKFENLNLREEYGALTAVTKRYIIECKADEGILVEFFKQKGSTLLSGIKIRKI